MLSVEFRGVEPGACSWCRKEKNEAFKVVISDRPTSEPKRWCWNCLRNRILSEVVTDDEKAVGRRAADA